MNETRVLKPAESLIVAADFNLKDFGGPKGTRREILKLARKLRNTGVVIKTNAEVRGYYTLIDRIHQYGLSAFVDLKLKDIPETMTRDALILADYRPEFLTVMVDAHEKAIRAVVDNINEGCEVLAVTVLTSLDNSACKEIYQCLSKTAFSRLARIADRSGVDGLILSPLELKIAIREFGDRFSLNTPGIRPADTSVKGEDQKRTGTPYFAIKSGATRIVVGRAVTQAKKPYDAVMPIIDEIARAREDMQ